MAEAFWIVVASYHYEGSGRPTSCVAFRTEEAAEAYAAKRRQQDPDPYYDYDVLSADFESD